MTVQIRKSAEAKRALAAARIEQCADECWQILRAFQQRDANKVLTLLRRRIWSEIPVPPERLSARRASPARTGWLNGSAAICILHFRLVLVRPELPGLAMAHISRLTRFISPSLPRRPQQHGCDDQRTRPDRGILAVRSYR
jgi:hypothetical protein